MCELYRDHGTLFEMALWRLDDFYESAFTDIRMLCILYLQISELGILNCNVI